MKHVKTFLGVLLSLVILWYLSTLVELTSIQSAFSKVTILAVLGSFLAYFILYLFRVWRFLTLTHAKIPFLDMFRIVCIHNFLNNLLPARLGEISYPYLMRKHTSAAKGLGTLIIARLFDILLILLLFFFSLLFFREVIILPFEAYLLLVIGVFLLLCVFILLIIFRKKAIRIVKKIMKKLHLLNVPFFHKIFHKIEEIIESFEILKKQSTIGKSILFTFGIVFSQYLFFYVLMKSLGLPIGFIEIVIGSALILIVALLPIQGFAGFGTFEGAWTLALLSFGMSQELSVTSSFVIHILQIVYFVFFGIVGYLLTLLLRSPKSLSK